jgi:uncharacterized YccA/Bax inhibitor family protein
MWGSVRRRREFGTAGFIEEFPLRSSNPAFSQAVFAGVTPVHNPGLAMTVRGTVGKTALLAALFSTAAIWTWGEITKGSIAVEFVIGAAIGGFVIALLTGFVPRLAPWTSPVYAVFQGLCLGALSRVVDIRFPGIAIQAILLSSGTLFCMLGLYATRTVRVTDKLRTGIFAGTSAICLIYLVTMLLNLFGLHVPYIHGTGPIGIIFSLVVVGLAALNLLLDFDFIERASHMGAPRYMEWYGAFGLMVTMVWLYIEILNLLMKLQGRSSDD